MCEHNTQNVCCKAAQASGSGNNSSSRNANNEERYKKRNKIHSTWCENDTTRFDHIINMNTTQKWRRRRNERARVQTQLSKQQQQIPVCTSKLCCAVRLCLVFFRLSLWGIYAFIFYTSYIRIPQRVCVSLRGVCALQMNTKFI